MPSYEFRCEDCRKKFTIVETFSEHARHQEKCPKCGSRKLEQLFTAVSVRTSKKS